MSKNRRERRKAERVFVARTLSDTQANMKYLEKLKDAGATIHECYRELTNKLGYDQVEAAKIAGKIFEVTKQSDET